LAEVLAPTPPPKPLWDPTPPIPQNVPLAATSLTAKNLAELRREEDRREAEEIRELIAKTSKGDLTKVVWERRRSISKELEPELDLPEEPPMVKAPISKEAEDINKLVQEAEKARSNAGRRPDKIFSERRRTLSKELSDPSKEGKPKRTPRSISKELSTPTAAAGKERSVTPPPTGVEAFMAWSSKPEQAECWAREQARLEEEELASRKAGRHGRRRTLSRDDIMNMNIGDYEHKVASPQRTTAQKMDEALLIDA